MKIIPQVGALCSIFSLLALCSCTITSQQYVIVPAAEQPADTTINRIAGRGGHLIVNLRLDNGDSLPFIVDTGSTGTVFDKSFESKLGKRLGKQTLSGWQIKTNSYLYA